MKRSLLNNIILFLFFCLFCSGCTSAVSHSEDKLTRTILAMDTVMDLSIYGGSEAILDEAAKRISDLENKLSVTLSGSEIHTLNTTGNCTLSDDTITLLTDALKLCESTNGALDISIYPVLRAWGFTTGEYQIPDEAELSSLLNFVDYSSVTLEGSTVSLPQNVQIDLGSVAKGYTGDVLCELLKENGVTSAILNLGGNVQTLGSKPDGTPWRIAIQHPSEAEEYLGVLSLSDMAAITSGGYERCFTGEDGNTYWHILDPATGKPANNGILSVTVVGERGLLCDALSTALFVMGLDKASEYWRTHEGFEVLFATDDGAIHITEGLTDLFTPSEAYTDKGVTVIKR